MEMLALLIVGLLFSRVLLSLIYCIVTLISAVKAIKLGRPHLFAHAFMGFAGIMLFIINFPDYYYMQFLKPALAGFFLISIHILAVINGKAAGETRIRRHVLRLLVSLLIFALFFTTSRFNDAFVWRSIFGLN